MLNNTSADNECKRINAGVDKIVANFKTRCAAHDRTLGLDGFSAWAEKVFYREKRMLVKNFTQDLFDLASASVSHAKKVGVDVFKCLEPRLTGLYELQDAYLRAHPNESIYADTVLPYKADMFHREMLRTIEYAEDDIRDLAYDN